MYFFDMYIYIIYMYTCIYIYIYIYIYTVPERRRADKHIASVPENE